MTKGDAISILWGIQSFSILSSNEITRKCMKMKTKFQKRSNSILKGRDYNNFINLLIEADCTKKSYGLEYKIYYHQVLVGTIEEDSPRINEIRD